MFCLGDINVKVEYYLRLYNNEDKVIKSNNMLRKRPNNIKFENFAV